VAVEVRFFVASRGYATHRDRKLWRVTTFSRPGRAIARRAAGATERTPARVRSARAAKRAEARETPTRGSVAGGWSRETRGNARRRCAWRRRV